MTIVHEKKIKYTEQQHVGPTTTQGKNLGKLLRRKKVAMMKLLDERALWIVVGTDQKLEDHRLDDVAVKKMLQTGEAPWDSGSITGGAELYWGKMALRASEDLKRSTEELPVLKEEFKRLKSWATLNLSAIDERLVEVERNEEHGKSILLGRWKVLLQGILTHVTSLINIYL
jgi:hypothetical protein